MSWNCVTKNTLLDNTSSKRLQDVFKMSWRRLCNTSWRRLKSVFKTSCQDALKTSRRRTAKTNILVLTKTSWRCLGDVFWRRKAKANIFVFIKTSWTRLLKTKDAFKTSSSRRIFAGKFVSMFLLRNVSSVITVKLWL